MVEIIDLVSDDEAPRAVRRTRPRPVVSDAELSIVAESIQPLHPPRPHTATTSSPAPVADTTKAPPSKQPRAVDDSVPQVVALKKGINPLEDYPHPRFACTRRPFSSASARQFCHNCFCFVCDILADKCRKWGDHCRAVDSDEWKRRRTELRKATKRYDRGVDRLANEARQRENRARAEQERRQVMEALGDTRNFAEFMAEQVHIASQYHHAMPTTPHPLSIPATQLPAPFSSHRTPSQSPAQTVRAQHAPQPLNASPNINPSDASLPLPVSPETASFLAAALSMPPPSDPSTVQMSTTVVPFPAANVISIPNRANQIDSAAPNVGAQPPASFLHTLRPIQPDTSEESDDDSDEESEQSADSEDEAPWADTRTNDARLASLLEWQQQALQQKALVDARTLTPYTHTVDHTHTLTAPTSNAANTSPRQTSSAADSVSPNLATSGGISRGTSLNAALASNYNVRTHPFVEETVIDRCRSRKRRASRSIERDSCRGRSSDRGGGRERSSSQTRGRARKVARLMRPRHA
eukprot:TRINITY_DN2151_c0_g1_i1.p1 TRINITY_DN2151_c0_g1~~TRINITY_DN2151_c0_g1_i1.p1  ORF type:complete len:553 (+),score=78.05 TRINITY_DN2151_c0_g1_i1:85-1659(+)